MGIVFMFRFDISTKYFAKLHFFFELCKFHRKICCFYSKITAVH